MDYKQDYYVGEAHKELERRKQRAELCVEEWEKVEHLRKKDGTEFANIKNSFTKGVIQDCSFGGQQAKITTYANGLGYDSDYIDITPSVSKYSNDYKKWEEQGRIIDGGYACDYVILTPDEVEQAIKDRANYWRGVIKEIDEALARFDEITEKLVSMREEAKKYIEDLPEHYVFQRVFKEERQ